MLILDQSNYEKDAEFRDLSNDSYKFLMLLIIEKFMAQKLPPETVILKRIFIYLIK